MRSNLENPKSDEQSEQLAQPLPYEQPLGQFLHQAFQADLVRAQRGLPYTPDWKLRYLPHSYRASDGSALSVRQTNWHLRRPPDGGGLAANEWQGVVNADPDGVVRPRYRVTVSKGSDAYAGGPDGTIDMPAKETNTFNVVVDGDRVHVYELLAPPQPSDDRPVLRSPVPADPATAEQLTTLLCTGTPINA